MNENAKHSSGRDADADAAEWKAAARKAEAWAEAAAAWAEAAAAKEAEGEGRK